MAEEGKAEEMEGGEEQSEGEAEGMERGEQLEGEGNNGDREVGEADGEPDVEYEVTPT
jgi:hypothetical protein